MTLIEVMIVVTIIGILAAIAIPSFVGYQARSRASESLGNLAALYRSAAAYYQEEFPPDRSAGTQVSFCAVESAGPLPATPGVAVHVVDFSADPSFAALGFGTDAPIRYAYEIVSAGGCSHAPGEDVYSFRAHGDLDGDGTLSLFEVSAGSNGDNVLLRTPGTYIERGTE